MSQTKKSATPSKAVKKTGTKSVLPKMPARKTPAKKTVTPKTTSKKTVAKKPTATKTSPAKKLTLAEMQGALTSLETRMKRANTLTRKSVKTLEDVVTTLDTRTRKDNTAQKSALSRRVGKLSNDLEEGMATTRAEIRSALASALANPNQPAVETAVNNAIARLETNETKQAQSIAKINRHLANLAKAVEDRIIKDQMAATEALHAVETRLSSRLDSIETDSASALTDIGNKVATLTQAMDDRHSRSDDVVALKISELAAQTQAEFDKSANSMMARLEKLEEAEREAALIRPQGLSNDMSANVSVLSGQVETLQSRLDTIDASFTALQTQTEIMSQDLQRAQWQLEHSQTSASAPSPAPMPEMAPPQTPQAPAPTNVVSFTPQTLKPQPRPNPYAEMSAQAPQPVSDQPEHFPVEFDPNAFTQTATAYAQPAQQPVPQAPISTPPPMVSGGVNPGQALNMETLIQDAQNEGIQGQALQQPITNVENIPAGDPLLPYENPAYAEEHMDSLRIAEGKKPKKRRPKKVKAKKVKAQKPKGEGSSILTPRNLRVAALATGVAVVGLFAAKTFLSPQTAPLLVGNGDPAFVQSPNGPVQGGPVKGGPVQGGPQTAPPIGQYAETDAPVLNASTASTIEAAAADGDAIAQFQLGLSKLEQNNTDEGVPLIRNAANTLPAAQYRLAKLYETGTGVAKDTAMAKDLTERAARAGNRIAMHDLAIYYAYGNGGVGVDMGTAAGWFEKAAERGVVDSQFNLAILFENGQGVTPSPSDAYFWYTIASSQGDQTATARLLALDEIMAPADIDAAKTRATNFSPVKINQEANGIFKNLPWQKNDNSAQRAQVRQVQTLLADVGFDVGAADGIMGKRTREAITTFERTNGMDQTGQVSAALIEKLSIASGA